MEVDYSSGASILTGTGDGSNRFSFRELRKNPAMRRSFASLFAVLILLPFLCGAGQAPPARKIEFTADQQAALDKVSTWLNTIHTMRSGFIQLGPEGQFDQGE